MSSPDARATAATPSKRPSSLSARTLSRAIRSVVRRDGGHDDRGQVCALLNPQKAYDKWADRARRPPGRRKRHDSRPRLATDPARRRDARTFIFLPSASASTAAPAGASARTDGIVPAPRRRPPGVYGRRRRSGGFFSLMFFFSSDDARVMCGRRIFINFLLFFSFFFSFFFVPPRFPRAAGTGA